MSVPNKYNGGGPLAGVVLVDASTGDPYVAGGGSGGATGPGTAANAQRVTYASDGASVPIAYPVLPTATKRTGSATTTSSQFVAANTSRRGLTIQNLSTTATLYVDEFGGTVTAGSASYTVGPLQSVSIQTQNAVTVLASTGTINLNGTEF